MENTELLDKILELQKEDKIAFMTIDGLVSAKNEGECIITVTVYNSAFHHCTSCTSLCSNANHRHSYKKLLKN